MCSVQKGNVYTIVAPSTISSNSSYQVCINLFESENPLKVKVGIKSKSFEDFKTVEVQPLSSELAIFEIPDLEYDDYILTTESISGPEFKNTTQLNLNLRKNIILVQTDKAGIYKPGDLVRFRALILDKNTRPLETKPINIFIYDPKNNRIKQFNNVQLNKGVFSGDLQLLPSFSKLGTWKIEVEFDGEKETKSFEVSEYVLPKFEVFIDSKKHFVKEDGILNVTVGAKYTYGKPVKGKVKVIIQSEWYEEDGEIEDEIYTKTVSMDGKVIVPFNIEKDLEYCNGEDFVYTITAVVEEDLTGITGSKTTDLTGYKDLYRMHGVSCPSFYKFDEPFNVTISVKTHEGSPVKDSINPVKFYLNIPDIRLLESPPILKQLEKETKETYLNENGLATASFTMSSAEYAHDSPRVNIVVKYLDTESSFMSLKKIPHDHSDELAVKIDVENAKLGTPIPVRISTKFDLKYFCYQIVGRSQILESKFIKISKGGSDYKFDIEPIFEIIPNISLFIHLENQGELIYRDITIDFEQNLKNYIELQTPSQAAPGDVIDIKVVSKPNSLIGILGIDQNVLLLKDENDINKSKIYGKISEFKPVDPWMFETPGRGSGLTTYTNAESSKNCDTESRYFGSNRTRRQNEDEFLDVPTPLNRQTVSYRKEPPLTLSENKIRNNFPETWLWDIVEIRSDSNERIISYKVPDTITSWVLTAFSLNCEHGIGVTKSPKTIEVFQPFFVTTNLPYSIKRGETISIPAIVFNYQDIDTEVKITFDNADQDFEFVDETGSFDDKRSIRATLENNVGLLKSFLVRPKKLGYIPLKLSAVSSTGAVDSIKKMLLVEPEGHTEYVKKSFLFNLKEGNEENREITIDVPEGVVPDSTFVQMSATGNLLAPIMTDLETFFRTPPEGGEQIMNYFVPNLLVLQYLQTLDHSYPVLESKAKYFLRIAYQQQLLHKHENGSYSSFGDSDEFGSTWLTAYVAKSFMQASEFIHIDDNVIKEALDFLISNQALDGSVSDLGELTDSGFPDKSLALTAFVMLTFVECRCKFLNNYDNAITNGINYLASNLNDKTELFDYAISTYALQKAQHNSKNDFLDKLQSFSKQDGNYLWWPKEKEKKKDDYFYYYKSNTDIGITSYSLMTLLESNTDSDILPILRWLLATNKGSMHSSILKLSAFIKLFEKFSLGPDCNFEMNFIDDSGIRGSFISNKENLSFFQTHTFNPTPKAIKVHIKGFGMAYFKLLYRYNIVHS